MSRGSALEAAFPVRVLAHSPECEQALLRLMDDGCGAISSGLAPVCRSCRDNGSSGNEKAISLSRWPGVSWCPRYDSNVRHPL